MRKIRKIKNTTPVISDSNFFKKLNFRLFTRPSTMRNRRRKYIVNSKFQGKFILGFVLVCLIASVATTVLFNYLAILKLEELQWRVHSTVLKPDEVLEHLFIQVSVFFFIFFSVLLAATGAWIIRKINGPVYRMVQGVQTMLEGDLSSDIVLRSYDEFKDVARALGAMRGKNQERFKQIRTGFIDISQALAELELDYEKSLPLEEKTEKIISMVKELQDEIPF